MDDRRASLRECLPGLGWGWLVLPIRSNLTVNPRLLACRVMLAKVIAKNDLVLAHISVMPVRAGLTGYGVVLWVGGSETVAGFCFRSCRRW